MHVYAWHGIQYQVLLPGDLCSDQYCAHLFLVAVDESYKVWVVIPQNFDGVTTCVSSM